VPGAWEKVRSLAEKSLVRWDHDRAAEDEAAGGRMLETIREFAQERLAASGEEAAVQRAHVGYALSFADEAWPHLSGPNQGEWLDRLEADLDNLREALAWALADDPRRALLLARLLGTLWKRRGYFREALSWHDRILAAAGHLATADRAWVLCDAGWMAETLGDLDRAERCHVESLELARMLPDDRSIWRALNHLGMVAQSRGEIERALALREETLAAARATGDEKAIDSSLANLGGALLAAGDIDGAASRLEESLAIRRTLGDPVRLAEVQNYVGLAAAWRGDFDGAVAHYERAWPPFARRATPAASPSFSRTWGRSTSIWGRWSAGAEVLRESLARHRDLGDRRNAAIALINLAEAAVRQREAAAPLLAEALSLLAGIGDQALAADVLEQIARLVVERGEAGAEAALRLAGGAEAVWRATGASRQPPNAPLHEAAMATARAALVPKPPRSWETGLAAGFDEAVADALAALAADHGRLAASLT
jgi:tetratricopeptide (TPR) repeat protein